jgi:penicillin-binding protein 1A
VAIETSTGEVRAMVGGRSFDQSPFNLATEGERQPGSSFKAFDLAAALEDGISPYSVWSSKVKVFKVPHSSELFVVHNDENAYTGENSLIDATAYSDNSIYAEVGLKVGTHRIARIARKMGIGTPISTNPAMTIGGLHVGVTPLDMAHAYETIAHGGDRVSGTLAETPGAPVGIMDVNAGSRLLPDGHQRDVNHTILHPVLPAGIARTETQMLETVLQFGTARSASLGQFAAGKTGTTSNYGDAWFVGWDSRYTVAVWVGYPNGLVPMTTQFEGGPVLGGTFPALIWHDFMVSAMQVEQERANAAHRTDRSSVPTPIGAEPQTAETAASSHGSGQQRRPSGTSGKGATEQTARARHVEATPSPETRSSPTSSTAPATGAAPAGTTAPPEGGSTQAAPATPSTPSAPTSAPSTGGAAAPTGGVSPGG